MSIVQVVPPDVADQCCRMCGARRRPGERDSAWVADRHWTPRLSEMRRVRREDGAEVDEVREPAWHRRHLACVPQAAPILEVLTGVQLTEDQGLEALRQHGVALPAGDRQAAGSKPWGHIGRNERAKLTALAVAVGAPPEPVRHDSGRCGVCGVSRSTRWVAAGGLQWSDRTPAVACTTCAPMIPAGADLDLVKLRALAEMTGTRPSPSLRGHDYYRFKTASEVLQGDERHDDGAGRWSYRKVALHRVRAAVVENLPELLLDEGERARGVQALLARRARAASEEARRQAVGRPGGDVEW